MDRCHPFLKDSKVSHDAKCNCEFSTKKKIKI